MENVQNVTLEQNLKNIAGHWLTKTVTAFVMAIIIFNAGISIGNDRARNGGFGDQPRHFSMMQRRDADGVFGRKQMRERNDFRDGMMRNGASRPERRGFDERGPMADCFKGDFSTSDAERRQ